MWVTARGIARVSSSPHLLRADRLCGLEGLVRVRVRGRGRVRVRVRG